MQFIKKTRTYHKEYETREDAKKALMDDSRIKSIRIHNTYDHDDYSRETEFFVIETQPIFPKKICRTVEGLLLDTIGSYFIYMKTKWDMRTKLVKEEDGKEHYKEVSVPRIMIKIERKYGPLCFGVHSPHVLEARWDGICWGNVEDDVFTICQNTDYYWATKYCLDLLEDWTDDDIGSVSFASYLFFGQLQEHPSLKKQLVKRLKDLYESEGEFYNEYHSSNDKYDNCDIFASYGIGNPRPKKVEENTNGNTQESNG